MKKELAFITVTGKDQKGILAKIAGLLYKNNINIVDTSQKVLEKIFVMAMLVEIPDYKKTRAEIAAQLDKIGKQLGLKIKIQHRNFFEEVS